MFGTLKFTFTLCTALISICHAGLPPPTNLTAEWIDPLTVRVSWSWERPKDLPHYCTIKYKYIRKGTEPTLTRQGETHFLDALLTESTDEWECSISVQTEDTSPACKGWNSSEKKFVIKAPKPRAVVTDFKCYLFESHMNCSWIEDSCSPVSVSYRDCGKTPELLGKFSYCSHIYTSEGRRVCQMNGTFLQKKLCMVMNTSNGIHTFKANPGIKLPNMKISENGTNLILTFAPLAVQMDCSVINVCYSVCDKSRICLSHSPGEKPLVILGYYKSCQYKFWYRVETTKDCSPICSDWSENIIYGFTDWTATVVAIVIPLIVSACVILSCICFRRHRDIICPDVPDPSTMFKEIINGSKDIKPSVSMYTPVQEPIETIIIVSQIPKSSGLVPT